MPQQRPYLYGNQVTSSSLIGLKTHKQEENHAWFWKPSHLLRAREIMDLRKEYTTVTLLDYHLLLLQIIIFF